MYDGLNKVSRTDPNNVLTQYAYDKRNRLDAITYPPSASGDNRDYVYDDANNLLSVNIAGGTERDVVYIYDELNRVRKETSNSRTHMSRYDANGNRRLCYYGVSGEDGLNPPTHDGLAIDTMYDALNRVVDIDAGDGSTLYKYDLNGKRYV